MSRITAAGTLATLALALASPGPASAGAIDPSHSAIGDSARLSAGGRAIRVQGIVRCTGCSRFTLGATISQGASGAVAQGGVRCVCQGGTERWFATARAREATRFRPGPARVCVWIIARGSGGAAIDAAQWCERAILRFAAT
jgi:hypothetical protein